MAPGDHPETAAADRGARRLRLVGLALGALARGRTRTRRPRLSLRLRHRPVHGARRARRGAAARQGPIRVVSLCAGQGRDVIDVVATHPRGRSVSALLVELDPAPRRLRPRPCGGGRGRRAGPRSSRATPRSAALVRGRRARRPGPGVRGLRQHQCGRHHAHHRGAPGVLPAGVQVIWTRHRRPPDATPAIRADFAAAGFTEVAFEAPDGYVLSVGRHRLDGPPAHLRPGAKLFDFVGDGVLPA